MDNYKYIFRGRKLKQARINIFKIFNISLLWISQSDFFNSSGRVGMGVAYADG